MSERYRAKDLMGRPITAFPQANPRSRRGIDYRWFTTVLVNPPEGHNGWYYRVPRKHIVFLDIPPDVRN